jgi:MFS family permease
MISEGSAASEPRHARSLWHNRDFVLLWSGQTVSRLGSRMSDLALPLLVLALTGSALQAGLIAATQLLPYLILSLPAGALLDRWNRKRVMILCDAARGLAMASIPVAYVAGCLDRIQLYAVALVVGLALVFFDCAEGAALPNVVPATQLTQAVGLVSTAEAATYLVGPGLAGVLIGLARTTVAGAALAYLIDGLSYLISLLTLRFIRLPFQKDSQQGTPLSGRALVQEIREGLRFLWTQRRLRLLVLLSTSINLLDGALVLALIVLARNELHAGVRTIGVIFTLAGAGELLGSFIAPWIEAHWHRGRVLVGAIAVWACAMPLEAAATTPLMLVVGAALADMMLPIYNVTQSSYRLSLIPDALRGRVSNASRLPSYGSGLLGTAGGSLLLGLFGPRPVLWLIAGGLGLCALAASLSELRRA